MSCTWSGVYYVQAEDDDAVIILMTKKKKRRKLVLGQTIENPTQYNTSYSVNPKQED